MYVYFKGVWSVGPGLESVLHVCVCVSCFSRELWRSVYAFRWLSRQERTRIHVHREATTIHMHMHTHPLHPKLEETLVLTFNPPPSIPVHPSWKLKDTVTSLPSYVNVATSLDTVMYGNQSEEGVASQLSLKSALWPVCLTGTCLRSPT